MKKYLDEQLAAACDEIMISDETMSELLAVEVENTFATQSRDAIALMFGDLDMEEFEAYKYCYPTPP